MSVSGETQADRPAPAAASGDWAIRTEGLTKRFGSVAVVDDIALEVPTGSVFGFLGPNGSGKTTTIRMLLGLITPSAGTVELLGRDMPGGARDVLPAVGALVEGPAFYPWLSGRQNLVRFDAAGRSRSADRALRVAGALERVGLTAAAAKKYRAYSLGMRQRLGLAAAMLQPRRLLVLDEPTNGMDPQGTREIRHLLRDLAAEGTTVFVSSHLLSEIEQTCTHVAVMSLGRLLMQQSLAALALQTPARVHIDTPDLGRAAELLISMGVAPIIEAGSVVADAPGDFTAEELCRQLVLAGIRVSGYRFERPSLEDTFVALTGEGFDVAR